MKISSSIHDARKMWFREKPQVGATGAPLSASNPRCRRSINTSNKLIVEYY